jgi:hypothetical protein
LIGRSSNLSNNLLPCLFPRRRSRNQRLSLARGDRETWKGLLLVWMLGDEW